jgi:phosphoribosyl 1,2-cyclic phosphodiesterase
MRVRFFGTRGSIATPGPRTLRYGGNTSCVEVRSNAGTLVVLDMGTGAAVLGRELMQGDGPPAHGHILISHTHWDHIQGIPFFAPLKVKGTLWDIYAPRGFGQTLREILAGQMQETYFPIGMEQLGATIRYHDPSRAAFASATSRSPRTTSTTRP